MTLPARLTMRLAGACLVLSALCPALSAQPVKPEEARALVAQLVTALNARDIDALRKLVSDQNFLDDMQQDFQREMAEVRIAISVRETAVTPEGMLAACPSTWTAVRKGRERSESSSLRLTIVRDDNGLRIAKVESDENIRMRQAGLLGRRLGQACAQKDLAELAQVLNLNETETAALRAGDAVAAAKLRVDWLLDPLAGRAILTCDSASRNGPDAVAHCDIKAVQTATRKDLTVKLRPGELGKESYYLDFDRPAEEKP